MDEYEASAVPKTEGREATTGRGADTAADRAVSAPVHPAVAAVPELPIEPPPPRPAIAVRVSRPSTMPPRSPMRPDVSARSAPPVASTSRPAMPAPGGAIGAPPPAATQEGIPARIWTWTRRLVFYGAVAFALWFVAVIGMIALFRFVDPPFSNLMLLHRLSGNVVVQRWLPIEKMPTQLIRAIVVSEDGRFCAHRGIDLKEIELAIERSKDGGMPRGASTITMQVAKNLFLWPSKTYIRKALEVPLTLAIEAMWSKRRIFEVYANIAEWGPGVFGVEAAAGYHFGKSAGRVNEKEAALLAVALPNPVTRDAGDPGPGTVRLASTIQARMRAMSRAASCIERGARI